MTKKNYHVTKPKGSEKWCVKKAGVKRVVSSHALKGSAIKAGKSLAKKAGVKLIVHKTGGKIQDVHSF